MALKIRLSRKGSNNNPLYRVVVQDRARARGGKFKEIIGYYDPRKKEEKEKLVLKKDRYDYWCSKGAQPTKTIYEMVRRIVG